MNDDLLGLLVLTVVPFILFGAVAGVGIVTVVRSHDAGLRVAGYVVAIAFGFVAAALPVWIILTSAYGSSCYDNYGEVSCPYELEVVYVPQQ